MADNFLLPAAHRALVARLHALRRDSAHRWGWMSAGQMLVHCADQLRVSRGEKPVTSVRIPGFLKPVLKWWFVSRLKAFKPGMRTLRELDPDAGMSAPTAFEADRAALLALLDPARYGLNGLTHPVFGHLTAREFGEVVWKHLDHHLRQFGV